MFQIMLEIWIIRADIIDRNVTWTAACKFCLFKKILAIVCLRNMICYITSKKPNCVVIPWENKSVQLKLKVTKGLFKSSYNFITRVFKRWEKCDVKCHFEVVGINLTVNPLQGFHLSPFSTLYVVEANPFGWLPTHNKVSHEQK